MLEPNGSLCAYNCYFPCYIRGMFLSLILAIIPYRLVTTVSKHGLPLLPMPLDMKKAFLLPIILGY